MKRISIIAAAAAVALSLSACGSSEESSDASGLRKGNTESVSATPAPTTTARPPAQAPSPTQANAPTTTAKSTDRPSGNASSTTCSEFRALDSTNEKALIERILAENPNSPFAGSPNVALGTAKLVCLASSNADKTVAEAAGIVT
ncbi:hypothetical protein [Nocardia bovistercoris]|uniref:DUF732 domain-containing protein n=1 Tax=Nocardia bovistercoris TaxID=2785916 RepID=A0A931ICW2_9NOCA|nr:hypothetical protein [Nocardia bovistercoris]MBH0778201.1 hypothetical protein [Nocardia bovistercoris]